LKYFSCVLFAINLSEFHSGTSTLTLLKAGQNYAVCGSVVKSCLTAFSKWWWRLATRQLFSTG